ncbi:putative oxidoreductase GLYR1 homolog [Nephila pilipes]|uniref:Putative oxidoreductase GLYR1 homolog n=1 Tax=Nephila pilipes TaxID=299642 RepID=A0A8X6UTF9_NEPPI|nr:putative oxidoreductase GLYR1 homolog [Nephila pilipes]
MNKLAVKSPLKPSLEFSQTLRNFDTGQTVKVKKKIKKLKKKKKKNPVVSKKIGFIGLGMMGERIVRHLMKTGHNVSIWNRTPEKGRRFVIDGAHQYLTPADVMFNCDITFCCVSGPEASRSVMFGETGILKGLERYKSVSVSVSKGYVEMTSIDPITSQEIAAAITSNGGKYLEAPFRGSRKLADEGCLLLLCAGDLELFNKSESCLCAISKNAWYLSRNIGSGSKMNITLSMLMGTTHAAVGEAMALVENCNLSRNDFVNILSMTSLACPLLLETGHSMVSYSFVHNNTLKYQQQDMNLALTLGFEKQQPMMMTTAANEMYKEAKRMRLSDRDVSTVFLAAKSEQQ